MTISSTTVKNSYSGNGTLDTFNYTFKIFADSDLQVIIRDATATETVKTLTTHYTVTGAGSASGGTIVFTSGNIPSATETVVIRRAVPQTQAIDYIANDPFPAESHEEGLDRAMMTLQQVQEEVNRSIKLSRTNTMNNTEFTIGDTDRANKVFGFDSAGELVVTQELGTFRGDWSASTAYEVRDLVKDTSTNNIFICLTAHTSSGTQPLTTNTDSAKWSLIVDAASATSSASAAASSATAAAASATAAATSETNAATSETNAATSETNASTSETNAASSATSASTSASNAATSETNAATSETNASSSATAAASSATSAATQASNASTSATNAATSETNAASSATAAASSASAASTSASNASTSETNAATSATNASTAQTAAETAQAAAELAYDNFDDRYLGPKASDPTVDNDGDALIDGALYFNTTGNVLKYWDGSAWQNVEATDTSSFATNGFAIAMAIAL
jgi:DNA polymerase III gamma/tau subunit